MPKAYPYSTEWKQAQDKCSEPWRAYCEALSLAKKYLAARAASGVDTAVAIVEEYLGEVTKRRGAKAADALRQATRTVIEGEGRELVASMA